MAGMGDTKVDRVLSVVSGTLRRVLGGDRQPENTHHIEADVTVRGTPTYSHDLGVGAIPRSATRQQTLIPPPSDHGGVGGAFRDLDLGCPDDLLKNTIPPEEVTSQVGATAPKRKRESRPQKPLIEKIPVRAWASADYLRKLLLEQDPNNIVRSQPWGDDVKDGRRLQWANEFRLMVDNDDRGFKPDDYYTEIVKSLAWVFRGQGATDPQYRIIVEGASALRKKWDQIQRKRKVGDAPALAKPRPSTVLPVQRRIV